MDLDRRDQLSFDATPTVMVPRFGQLDELAIGRVRYLAASDGLYVEARSRAMHACLLVAPALGRLPYGQVKAFWKPAGGDIPREISDQFVALARRASPDETAALILWKDGRYQLHVPTAQEANRGRVSYSTAGIDPQDVVVDMHSHGALPAGFSGQDDADDAANPSLCFSAFVVGNLDQIAVSTESRIVVNGWAGDIDTEAVQLQLAADLKKPLADRDDV